MRRVSLGSLLVLLFGMTSCGLDRGRFQQIAYSAAIHAQGCDSIQVTPLRQWSFQMEGCGEVTYWRCFYDSEPGAEGCCRRVASEHDATKAFTGSLEQPRGPFAETLHCGPIF
jgi:hypothetical protein